VTEAAELNLSLAVETGVEVIHDNDSGTTATAMSNTPNGPGPVEKLEKDALFSRALQENSAADRLLVKIIASPNEFPDFSVAKGNVYTTNSFGREVLCIPEGLFKGRRVTEIIIDHGHNTIGHLGTRKTVKYV
jgi:hypothetical protein